MRQVVAKLSMVFGFGAMLAVPVLKAYAVVPSDFPSVAAMLLGFVFGMCGMIEWAFP